ncbi:hypothetical protein [Turicibacter sp. TJ11]|uniref:hypothetical protein n=1 Tax=Turicibacter sp. TJ11 TaxID=2806443 RepID=UPI001F15F40A|nr:hypothetical protein [Turicibacter sp. TJ11]
MKRFVMIFVVVICLCGCNKKSTVIVHETDINSQRLLILDEVNREDYETSEVYALGDPLVFLAGSNNDLLWQVTLTGYEVVEDRYEKVKKALVLHFNYRYLMQEFLMMQTLNPLISPTVFYHETALKQQSLAEATIAYNLGNYANSPHILYEPVVNNEMICQLVYLKPNSEQNCFSYYSYAGEGDYLISFETASGEHVNYLVQVKEERDVEF